MFYPTEICASCLGPIFHSQLFCFRSLNDDRLLRRRPSDPISDFGIYVGRGENILDKVISKTQHVSTYSYKCSFGARIACSKIAGHWRDVITRTDFNLLVQTKAVNATALTRQICRVRVLAGIGTYRQSVALPCTSSVQLHFNT